MALYHYIVRTVNCLNACLFSLLCVKHLNVFKVFLHFSPQGEPPNFFIKAGLGMAAGVVGAFVGTPAEVSLCTHGCQVNE